MRSLPVWLALLVPACSSSPTPVRPTPAISAVAPPSSWPPAVAPPSLPSRTDASSSADDGAPPDPPMAMRWTFHLPPFAGQPGTTQRLAVVESGDATWESAHGGGDDEVGEELSASPTRAPEVERCRRHLGPGLHRKLVMAARRAMASGCGRAGAADRLGRAANGATITLAVTWAGEITSCDVGRSGGSHAAFEAVRTETVAAMCGLR